MSPLYRKAAVLALLIAAFSVGMAYLLITFKVAGAHRELRHGRFELAAAEIDQVVEKSFSIGMALDELSVIPALLVRRKQADSAIRAIDIADAKGKIAYSTEPSHVGQPVPGDWQRAWARRTNRKASSDSGRWRTTSAEEAVAGSTLVNSFDEIQGFTAVRYSIAENIGTQAKLRESLGPIAWGVFAATALALFLILAFFSWRFEKAALAAAAQLDQRTDGPAAGGWRPLVAALNQRFGEATDALLSWAAANPVKPK